MPIAQMDGLGNGVLVRNHWRSWHRNSRLILFFSIKFSERGSVKRESGCFENVDGQCTATQCHHRGYYNLYCCWSWLVPFFYCKGVVACSTQNSTRRWSLAVGSTDNDAWTRQKQIPRVRPIPSPVRCIVVIIAVIPPAKTPNDSFTIMTS